MRLGTQHLAIVAAALTSAAFVPKLEARACTGNGDIVGSYGFIGQRSSYFLLGATAPPLGSPVGTGPMIPLPTTPPGTATATGVGTGTGTGTTGGTTTGGATTGGTTTTVTPSFVGSSTSTGSLVAGFNNANIFAVAGRIFADGMGNLYASPTPGLSSNVLVGTYKVASDCSLTISLYDPFPAATTTTGTGTGTGTTTGIVVTGTKSGLTTLQGMILNNGAEIDLIATNTNAAGAVLVLVKTAQFSSCTNATLSGNYTITGSGVYLASAGNGTPNSATGTGTGTTGTGTTGTGTTTTTGTTPTAAAGTSAGAFQSGATGSLGTPFNLLGRFVSNGNGAFISDNAALQSPLSAGFTGTYTVNADCTGTASLSDQNGVTRKISFVVVNTAAQCSVGGIAQSSARQELEYVFSDPGVFGSGVASQQ